MLRSGSPFQKQSVKRLPKENVFRKCKNISSEYNFTLNGTGKVFLPCQRKATDDVVKAERSCRDLFDENICTKCKTFFNKLLASS